MMKKQIKVVGLLKQNFRRTLHLIKLICFVLFVGVVIKAQSPDSARIVRATYDEDNNLVIQVDVPSDTAIADASLVVDTSPVELTIDAEPLHVEHWFILDASQTMLNVYPLLIDELEHIASVANENYQIGGIIFGNAASTPILTDTASAFDDWLEDYVVTPNNSACVLDAFASLNEMPQSAYVARRIVVIAGAMDTNCSGDVPELGAPVDFIVVGNNVNPLYQDIVTLSGGRLVQGAVLSISGLIADLPSAQNSSVYALTMPVRAMLDAPMLSVELENGQIITQAINPIGDITIVPTVTAVATSEAPTEFAVVESTQSGEIVSATSEATQEASAAVVATEATTQATETPSSSISNATLILGGGIAAVLVVLVMMILLLARSRTTHSDSTDERDFDTTIFNYDDEAEFDQTDIVTIREIASQLGPTHVANLINDAEDIIYEIHRPISTLGRQVGSDILIAGDNQISREHVRFITRDDNSIWITRMTRNPILINGVPMENTRQLSEGDLVQLSPKLQVVFQALLEGEK